MPNGSAEDDRDTERPQNSRADFRYRRSSGKGRLTLREVSEHNPANAFEFTGLFQMHQHTIHLVRFHRAVFEDQDRIPGVQFPGVSDLPLKKSQHPPQPPPPNLPPRPALPPTPPLP